MDIRSIVELILAILLLCVLGCIAAAIYTAGMGIVSIATTFHRVIDAQRRGIGPLKVELSNHNGALEVEVKPLKVEPVAVELSNYGNRGTLDVKVELDPRTSLEVQLGNIGAPLEMRVEPLELTGPLRVDLDSQRTAP